MNVEPITFIVPSRNTLSYLKLSVESLRKNLSRSDHEIIIFDDASNDGTWEWVKDLCSKDPNVRGIHNLGSERIGHTISYDIMAELAKNPWVMIFHSDMYASKLFDTNILSNVSDDNDVVSGTRIEPPLHPAGDEKIIANFGFFPEEFEPALFEAYCKIVDRNLSEPKSTRGAFAPIMFHKTMFEKINGHDPLYRPQSREDSSAFLRMIMAGANLIQSRNALVYHFTCRGSRFQHDGKMQPGNNSVEWQTTNYKGERNFVRKYGYFVETDRFLLPIVRPRYNVELIIDVNDTFNKLSENVILGILQMGEPWFDKLVFKMSNPIYEGLLKNCISKYIENESKITDFDLQSKILVVPVYESSKVNCVKIRADLLTQEFFVKFVPAIRIYLKELWDSGKRGEVDDKRESTSFTINVITDDHPSYEEFCKYLVCPDKSKYRGEYETVGF